jgi:hypothetical protein
MPVTDRAGRALRQSHVSLIFDVRQNQTMNTEIVHFELNEASIHLAELVAGIRDGTIEPDNTPALAIDLAHIMDHLCRAWNCKDMTHEQKDSITQEEFERLSNTVPNFMGERILGEYALS